MKDIFKIDIKSLFLEDVFYEMPIIGEGFDGIKLAVFPDDGGYFPHFHFYHTSRGIPKNGVGGGCILITEAKYFNHGTHNEKLKKGQDEALINFLKSDDLKIENNRIWDTILMRWNSGTSNMKVSLDSEIPDYKYNMKNYNKKKKG